MLAPLVYAGGVSSWREGHAADTSADGSLWRAGTMAPAPEEGAGTCLAPDTNAAVLRARLPGHCVAAPCCDDRSGFVRVGLDEHSTSSYRPYLALASAGASCLQAMTGTRVCSIAPGGAGRVYGHPRAVASVGALLLTHTCQTLNSVLTLLG